MIGYFLAGAPIVFVVFTAILAVMASIFWTARFSPYYPSAILFLLLFTVFSIVVGWDINNDQ